jgi:hypothetical protein
MAQTKSMLLRSNFSDWESHQLLPDIRLLPRKVPPSRHPGRSPEWAIHKLFQNTALADASIPQQQEFLCLSGARSTDENPIGHFSPISHQQLDRFHKV